MSEKVVEFFKKYIGFIIGVLVGIILLSCGLVNFIIWIGIIIGFGYLGMYIQNNKIKVKETLKNLIEKW